MTGRAQRGAQAPPSDRRQARPTAHHTAAMPAGGFDAGRLHVRGEPQRRPGEHRARERRRDPAWPAEDDVDRAFRAATLLLLRARTATQPVPPTAVHEDVERLRGILQLDSTAPAEALLDVDVAWLSGYARPEETAEAAARVPDDLTALPDVAPLVKTPRWRRLGVAPPRLV